MNKAVQVGDTVLYWIDVEGEMLSRPAMITHIHDEEFADIVAFPGNGVNDLKQVRYVDMPEPMCFTLRN